MESVHWCLLGFMVGAATTALSVLIPKWVESRNAQNDGEVN